LGVALKDCGRPDDALCCLQQGIPLLEAALTADDLEIADMLNYLGAIQGELKNYQQAIVLFRRACAIDEAKHGPEHARVAIRLSNLGAALLSDGQRKAAKETTKRALAIRLKVLGEHAPQTRILQRRLETMD
jgi:tetratricopeptide (TPR) repeat protein